MTIGAGLGRGRLTVFPTVIGSDLTAADAPKIAVFGPVLPRKWGYRRWRACHLAGHARSVDVAFR
jgi:hypothetical protein